jgi:endoglucanase
MKLRCDSSLLIRRYLILFVLGLCLPLSAYAQLPAATQIANEMTIGWNIGNSLEVPDGETAWGNPVVTRQLIDAVRNAGFNTLRIPCAWNSHADQSTLEIDPSWLARVKEVVDYGYANGMYVIINSHWDGGWLEENPYYSAQEEVNKKQSAYWTQIADYFKDYDEHLLFAGTNEVHHGYDTPSSENVEVQQSYLQTFVDAVRATGGNNAERTLLVQTYNTNIRYGFDYFTMPNDTIDNRLMVEVHHYDPYDFTLNTNNTCIYWGSPYLSQSACSWAQESYIDDLFFQVKANWISKGIPVVMGEYGVINRSYLNDLDAIASREYWLEYNTSAAKKNGVIPVYWDNGYAGDNGFAMFDRNTGAVLDQGALNALIDAATGSETDPIPVTGITLSDSDIEMETGETYPLSAVIQPADATDRRVTWTTDNPTVAGVSSNGLVTGTTAGNATITATTRDGEFSATCAVAVTQGSADSTYCNNPAPVALPLAQDGSGEYCWVTTGDIDSINSWNMALVEINGIDLTNQYAGPYAGTMPAASNGVYFIHYKGAYAWSHLEVSGSGGSEDNDDTQTVAVSGVSVIPASASVEVGTTTTLSAAVSPGDATDKTVTWNSSDARVATVDASGTVTGVAAGSATITVTTRDGSHTAGCAVTITGSASSGDASAFCDSPTAAALPLAIDGAGEFCRVTSGDISNINSWNMQLVEINGETFTNSWSNRMPARIDGKYYIHYVGKYAWSHLEVNGSGGSENNDESTDVDLSLLGYATQDGGTTGGSGGPTVNASTGDEILDSISQKKNGAYVRQ